MKTRGKRLAKISDRNIDFSDIPEISKSQAAMLETIRPSDFLDDHDIPKKTTVNLRLDSDIVSFFQKLSPRYQTSINKVLRGYMLAKKTGKK